jgi:deoxyhypusine synthase
MIKWRLSDEPMKENDDVTDPEERANTRCTIMLGYTSNMASCGVRDIIKYICQHKMIDAIVTTTGGVEEDFMKVLAPSYMGDFYLKGEKLRKEGLNRIGNLIVPNENYVKLEAWFAPIVVEMHEEQKTKGTIFSPSTIIQRMGERISQIPDPEGKKPWEDSIYYWCWKNEIPVFCPALTDGALGDVMYCHCYNESGFICDIVADIKRVNDIPLRAKKSGMIILGGGVIKHHINNANLMRNGADFSVCVNTATEYDGSDAGARPDEAISWGKIRIDA